jgi:hypothetical protein
MVYEYNHFTEVERRGRLLKGGGAMISRVIVASSIITLQT